MWTSCCGELVGFQALWVFRWHWMVSSKLRKVLNSLQGEISDTPEMHCKENRTPALSVSSALTLLSSPLCWCCVLFSGCIESHPCLHWGATYQTHRKRCSAFVRLLCSDRLHFISSLKPQKSCRCCTQKMDVVWKEITLSLVFEEDYDLAWPHYWLGEDISGNTN